MKTLNQQEKQKILKQVNEQFGIKKIPDNIIRTGKERIVLFSGDLKLLEKLEKISRVEGIGNYIAKEQMDKIRLSIEGTHIFKNQITKNIFELNKEQLKDWMHGNELNIKTNKKGFLVMKYKDDFLGCGKASENKITNFIPKNRRLKEKIN